MSVLDRLPSGEPIRLLHDLDQMSSEIKAPQTFGSSSVIPSRIFSADPYDVEVPAGQVRDIELEFIPDDLTFGGALCYQVCTFDPVSMSGGVLKDARLRVGSDNRQRWLMKDVSEGQLKFYFFAAGTGTFTANLI